MQQYVNEQGVKIQAERLGEDAGELAGFWHVVDKDGNEGHVTDEMFQANLQPVADTDAAPASGKK